jgi:copper chaperone CopZ
MENIMMKKIFHVEGMHCSNCAMNIEGIEDDFAGIMKISASYQKSQMVVEFDETKVSEGQIKSAVEKRGYQVIPI